MRSDDLAVRIVKHLMAQVPEVDPNLIDDVIVGNMNVFTTQGQRMAPTWETVVYFVRQPKSGNYKVAVEQGERQSAMLQFAPANAN